MATTKKCASCEKEFGSEKIAEYVLAVKKKESKRSEKDLFEPISLFLCDNCAGDKQSLVSNLVNSLKQRDFMKEERAGFIYIMWFEDEQGLIKNEEDEFVWYDSEKAFECANNLAKEHNKSVVVQKGYDIWRITPSGETIRD